MPILWESSPVVNDLNANFITAPYSSNVAETNVLDPSVFSPRPYPKIVMDMLLVSDLNVLALVEPASTLVTKDPPVCCKVRERALDLSALDDVNWKMAVSS